jgi:hypothetical protein
MLAASSPMLLVRPVRRTFAAEATSFDSGMF